MAKSLLRIKARQMRAKGESVNKIARKLKVSKGTASLWVRDIILSVEQLERLKKRSIKGAELGRLRSALKQKEKRLKLIEESKKSGIKRLENLTETELFTAGIALYWAEGSKKTREVQFCNSDPRLIKFMIRWMKANFNIKPEELTATVGINKIHKKREEIVRKYWSKKSGIPLKQFRKTSFKKTKNKKVYENFNKHYGTLSIKILKPARIYYKIIGLIEGLSEAGRRLVSRNVS